MQTSDLDEKFGELIEADPCAPEELNSTPESKFSLNEYTAPHLELLMSKRFFDFGLYSCMFSQMPLLWVVDREGQIHIALEEVVTIHSRRFLRPRLRGIRPGADETRLGHPALVGGYGRIGGELVFDQGWGSIGKGWV